ncbi:MAG TPA: glycosyltransferase [Ignavibacteria bacterium]|nr:glycosyltransferase [Ignavibacteria bacterium]
MSLADKVIKNTFYYVIFQLFGFLFPLILTPFIIAKIGEVQFGIYALVLGFIGMFSLFDLSISSSFIVFISKYYAKKDFVNLNKYINTGLFFYVIFSIIIVVIGFVFAKLLLSLLNIPPELFGTALEVYYIGLVVFFISGIFTIFSSILLSLQKMYITSAVGVLTGFLNLAGIIIILSYGSGLTGIMWVQLVTVSVSNILNLIYAKRSLPELNIGYAHLEKNPVKEMSKFGAQMQISKLATFASEKYDEFLLAYFSVLNNVTYFNVANRISRTGRLIPFQLIPQMAPVASELKANDQTEKLKVLFSDITKYLILISLPVFTFLFVFADLIITTWVGPGFEMSSNILRILAIGNLINMTFSAPGNSIIPNIGLPKYQMREGLIYLGINIILSYLLIRNYGIMGAAFGNVLSVLISSAYVFFVSTKYFSGSKKNIFKDSYLKPLASSLICGTFSAGIYYFSDKYLFKFSGRVSGLIYIIFLGLIFMISYGAIIFNISYLNIKDKKLIAKIMLKIIPSKLLKQSGKDISPTHDGYKNELVSVFIVTFNRLSMLKKCVLNILPTMKELNYELIIIDNASTDGTIEFLTEIAASYPQVRIILNEKNTGINAKSLGADETKGDFIIGVDDDVIRFPENWVEKMIYAYKNIPDMGYLATDVIQDDTTTGAKHKEDQYIKEFYDNGNIVLEVGPTGGWCFMISREVFEKVGKLITFKNRIFYAEDGDYVNRITNSGLKYGILSGLKVYHATGEFHNAEFKKVLDEKYEDYNKKEPIFYKIKIRLIKIFSLKRYFKKLNEYASRNDL